MMGYCLIAIGVVKGFNINIYLNININTNPNPLYKVRDCGILMSAVELHDPMIAMLQSWISVQQTIQFCLCLRKPTNPTS